MNNLNYSVIFQPEPEGGYTAIVPALPGCISYGKTVEKAREMISEAISLYLETLEEHNQPIPKESVSPLISSVLVKK